MTEYSPLISLSSGLQATNEVEKDILPVQEDGTHQWYQNYIQEKIVKKKNHSTTLSNQTETNF